MASKETNRERQENEFEVIQSIFGIDVQDLRGEKSSEWKPLDIKIALVPQKDSSGIGEAYAKTCLHVLCPVKYPKIPPKITLENSKGLSDEMLEELSKQLENQALKLKGEVMIYELSQTVQTFLHTHNKPPALSFYDEMITQKLKRDQEILNSKLVKENYERQVIMDEVLRRKEILKSQSKTRSKERHSISESSPHRTPSSSDSSESSSPYYRSHLYPNECTEHRFSDILYFHSVGRKIQKGCCLGHSQKGCVAYSGIDLETGQLLYITEWSIKYIQLEGNLPGLTVEEIIASIEKQVLSLSQLHHKNLISYECILTLKKKEGIVIYLVQDFVLGTSICSISGSLGWCAEGASMVARGVLDALIYLHNKGVSHNHLHDATVFMDNSGAIRVTDFALIPYLQELIGVEKFTKGDLPALGCLIESLSPTPHFEMRDFFEKCKSERTLSASDLLDHPFLRPVLFQEPLNKTENNIQTNFTEHSIQQQQQLMTFHAPVTIARSRLQTEFEVQQFLGSGAYGDVLKVRNILDNRQYAIKRIPLPRRSRQLYKKMTREVELLSRLNHENVVRYYNSWIENSTVDDEETRSKLGAGDWSISGHSKKQSNNCVVMEESEDSSGNDWINCMPAARDSSSDGIEFVNSNGDIIESDEESEDCVEESERNSEMTPKPKALLQYMYIQMEFCEKSTLRTAIDGELFSDPDRLWRLFREIVEGLSHIHQQGMIHRDLKPVNIFLDHSDQVKIGDFGLATTSFLALQQCQEQVITNQIEVGNSLTGKVGTTLYVAPELTDSASKSTYNQKVDLYSLGIILFEMCNPPFETGMERVSIMSAVRLKSIQVPESMLNTSNSRRQLDVIRWLLNHDPSKRPTAEELLSSELVPPAQLEANELQEMLRHALANPQSKSYKHLVARCLAQKCDTVMELTYHWGQITVSSMLEFVKNKIIYLFRKHGAIEIVTPLLTPYAENSYIHNNEVRLMTHSGSIVCLPHDLRIPFARHVALNGIKLIRRYTIGRIYREKKPFNFHPKQLNECAFDVITPNPGNLLIDAELLSIAYEITNELPELRQKNVSFRINHTGLLRAILIHCNVPTTKYNDVYAFVMDFMDAKISKFQLQSSLHSIMQSTKQSTSTLLDLLQTDSPLGGPRGSMHGSALRTLTRGRGEAAALAKGAIRELESVVTLAQGMGVTCPIHLIAGLPIGSDRTRYEGIIWQMTCDIKPNRHCGPYILAAGGRYDGLLSTFQKTAQSSSVAFPNREISGAGFSFALDKLINILGPSNSIECRSIDVVVCVTGSRPPLKDVTQILRALWASNIRSGIVEANTQEEAQELAKDLGAMHIIVLGEGGVLRVRSWDNNRFHEHHVTRPELIDFIQRLLKPEQNISEQFPLSQSTSGVTLKNLPLVPVLSNVNVIFNTTEKLALNMRRRYEIQLKQHMMALLSQFEKKERITIIATELPGIILGALTGAIDPRLDTRETKQIYKEINHITERYPKFKVNIEEIVEEIIDLLFKKKNPSLIGLYSITDSSYRIIL